MIEVDNDSYEKEVEQSDIPVVVDLWGPQCEPCLALMPDVQKLSKEYTGKVKFAKLNITGHRRLCIRLKVMSVPTILFYKAGEIVDRLSGDGVSIKAIKEKTDALLA